MECMRTIKKKPAVGDCPIITPADFRPEMIPNRTQPRPRGNNSTRNPRKYIDCVCAFDIETTRLPEIDQSFMYVWQFQIGLNFTVMGRTWDEFSVFLHRLCECIPDKNVSLVVLVHNLSYEFVYLRNVYRFAPDEVFAVKSRRVAKCTMFNRKLEFRCSYLHSNMSLAQYTSKMQVQHVKQSGEKFNYSKIRYPWTKLTDKEKRYCQYDVLGLVEAYLKEMQIDGDTLSTVPLTSTGYVRRDCKRAMRHSSQAEIRHAFPDEELYKMLSAAFRGGDTHANRYYAGKILHDVKSADRSSSYPDVMCNDRFPRGAFRLDTRPSPDRLAELTKLGKAWLATITFYDVQQSDPYWGFPYLPYHKCVVEKPYCLDNGRLLAAARCTITITDIDYKIISETYKWSSMIVDKCYYATYGQLPEPLILTTQSYYRKKTELKGVAGQEVYYTKSKNLLNSLYGMMAQDPVKQSIEYLFDDLEQFREGNTPVAELLSKNMNRAFLCYQWGVWVTAWARYRLYEGLRLAGHNAVYCDTDSVKYIGELDWTAYNKTRIKASRKSGSYAADPAGHVHYMGVYEAEHGYKRFITQGAKKYAYTYPESPGKIHVTIAGVNKAKGGRELKTLGGLKMLRPGTVFVKAGGTESVYNDFADIDMVIDGHAMHIGSNVCIKDSTYTMSRTDDYERILADPQLYLKLRKSFGDISPVDK